MHGQHVAKWRSLECCNNNLGTDAMDGTKKQQQQIFPPFFLFENCFNGENAVIVLINV